MSSKKKIRYTDEIDLIEIFIVVWKDKWRIFFITFLSIILMFAYTLMNQQGEPILTYDATTEIRPISTFDESKYESFNNYLAKKNIENVLYSIDSNRDKSLNLDGVDKNFIYQNINNSTFYKIDRTYLLKLFVDKMNENSILINAIKNTELVKKENYKDEDTYENEITRLSSSINISATKDEITKEIFYQINLKVNDKKKWVKFILFLEKATNEEIRNHLIEKIERILIDEERLRNYRIEDLDLTISNTSNSEELVSLRREMNILKQNMKIQRIKDLFENTPVINSNEFYAGKMIVLRTKYTSNLNSLAEGKKTMAEKLIVSIAIGLIIGIFYVFISNSIKKRK